MAGPSETLNKISTFHSPEHTRSEPFGESARMETVHGASTHQESSRFMSRRERYLSVSGCESKADAFLLLGGWPEAEALSPAPTGAARLPVEPQPSADTAGRMPDRPRS